MTYPSDGMDVIRLTDIGRNTTLRIRTCHTLQTQSGSSVFNLAQTRSSRGSISQKDRPDGTFGPV